MPFRILSSILLLLSVLYLPFWVSVVLALAGMAYFPFYLEAIFLFFLSDLLYGAPMPILFNILGASAIFAFICFTILEILKRKLRLDDFPKI